MARLSKTELQVHRKWRAPADAAEPADTNDAVDTSGEGPDSGRSAEREAQEHVLDHAARDESWLTQIWRRVKASTGRPSSRS